VHFYYYLASIALCEPDFHEVLGDNYNKIDDLYKILANFDSSSYYYNLSIQYIEKSNDLTELSENYTRLALLNLKFNKPNLAIKYRTIANDFLSTIDRTYEHHNAYNAAIEIYTKLNMKDSLIQYLNILILIEQETHKEQLQKSIEAVEVEQSLRTKELEFELLKKESDLKSRTNSFLIVVVVLVNQNRQQKKENRILFEQKEAINKAKEELQVAYDNIHELNATKDKFFSIIAPDLRNPLGRFQMFTELMHNQYDSLLKVERKEFIQRLNESDLHLNELLENLLDWARSQRGTIKYEPMIIDTNNIVANTLGLLNNSADEIKIELINSVPNDFSFFADANLITIVLRNLVSNAIKFTNENGRIIVESEKDFIGNDARKYNRIAVSDNGIGMSEEPKSKLFGIDVNFTSS